MDDSCKTGISKIKRKGDILAISGAIDGRPAMWIGHISQIGSLVKTVSKQCVKKPPRAGRREGGEQMFDIAKLLSADQQALVRTAMDLGIRIMIDGDRSKPTGKTTLCDYLKSYGANVCEMWELEEGGAKPDNDADRNSVFVVIRMNKALLT